MTKLLYKTNPSEELLEEVFEFLQKRAVSPSSILAWALVKDAQQQKHDFSEEGENYSLDDILLENLESEQDDGDLGITAYTTAIELAKRFGLISSDIWEKY